LQIGHKSLFTISDTKNTKRRSQKRFFCF
jgi:hypothetical protein